MFSFIESIAQLIVNVIQFVIHAFSFLIQLFTTIPRALAYITGVIAVLPAYVGGVILVSVSVAVILLIINHGSN